MVITAYKGKVDHFLTSKAYLR